MPDVGSSQPIIVDALVKLGYPAEIAQDCQPVRTGLSGASLYRIALPEGEAMLKLTVGTSADVPMQRAHREVAFYRDLADQLALKVPRVLAIHEDDALVAFVMASYRAAPAPAQWTNAEYLESARQLGRLHAMFWGKTAQLAYLSWLGWQQDVDATADIKQAYVYWQQLREQPQFAEVLNHEHYTWLRHLLTRIAQVPNLLQVLPLTVCHGDCITHNTLRDADGHLVWTDWQEVRLARGPEDLAFFLQRAEAEGASIAREAVIHAYHESLEEHAWTTIPVADIQRVMNAAELSVRVVYWPAYLKDAPTARLSEMFQRIRALTEALAITI